MYLKHRQLKNLAPAIALLFAPSLLISHPEARAIFDMPWHKEHFTHVLSVGYTQLGSAPNQTHADMKMIDHEACIVATMLGFDVDDSFAFNIDEDANLILTYAPGSTTAPFDVQWDQNGGEGHGVIHVTPEPGAVKRTVKLKLDRARFAGLGTRGIDIAIGPGRNGRVALCDIAISRTWTTKLPETFGQLKLTVKDDETGAAIPVRAGIYDASGRAPIPSESAALVERFGDKIRLLPIATRAFWPSPNRLGFYVNGEYTSKLPAGTYEVAVARGPEYRVYHGTFEIRKDSETLVAVSLKRYADLPGKGWISGDDHIHLQREEIADQNVWMQVWPRTSTLATWFKWVTLPAPFSSNRRGAQPGVTPATTNTRSCRGRRIPARVSWGIRFTKISKSLSIRMWATIFPITKYSRSRTARAAFPDSPISAKASMRSVG